MGSNSSRDLGESSTAMDQKQRRAFLIVTLTDFILEDLAPIVVNYIESRFVTEKQGKDYTGRHSTMGSAGSEPGCFLRPSGLLFADNYFIVCDSGNCRLQIFDRSTQKFLSEFGKYGEGDGHFRSLYGITWYNQELYVTDKWNQRVQILQLVLSKDSSQVPKTQFKRKWNLKFLPTGIVVWRDQVVIAGEDHAIHIFSLQGAELRKWGKRGRKPGQLNHPKGLAVDDDEIFVCDAYNQRVQVFNWNGKWVRTIEHPQFVGPESVCIFGDLLYVGDSSLFVFDKIKGHLLKIIENPPADIIENPPASTTGVFGGIAVDEEEERIYVSETDMEKDVNRLHVYE